MAAVAVPSRHVQWQKYLIGDFCHLPEPVGHAAADIDRRPVKLRSARPGNFFGSPREAERSLSCAL